MSAIGRIARRYARGLFGIDKGDIAKAKARRETLEAVVELFKNEEAARILRNPVMPAGLKKDLLAYALKEGNADQSLQSLFKTMVEEGRVNAIPELVEAYSELIDTAEGVAKADLVSAVALPDAEVQAIGKQLGQILDKKVEVRASVDAKLLGGFVAHVGNYKIDMSLRTKLDGLAASAAQDSLR